MRHLILLAASGLALAACSPPAADKTKEKAPEAAAAPGHTAEQARNLANFDDLDFNVYSGQKWDEFTRSHAPNILVHYPDGTTTTGLPAHLEMLKPQFVFAPDTRIREHPIKLADGNFTAVQGIMEGTFTQPMDVGGGKMIQPTGKAFKLPMLTVGRWENGLMVEEWLYWDNQAFMKQIGLAP
ncbi:ester cyclase [Brevundimonas sp. NPDC090276]|uniref:ester cyclase n=1 Tax=Brevundimonas sp. NPDC090276 TaxID=3363956 RepID=UPI00383A9D0C